MSITAAAGALAHSMAGGRAAAQLNPKFGVVFRFKVHFGGLALGAWQSCAGLRVEYKPTEVKAGGDYNRVRYLPGETSYPKIVLKRAVTAQDSMKLQNWLKQQRWQQEAAGLGEQATITLQDSYSHAVLIWTLEGARPVSWSVSDLDAKTSGIAIETLEVQHEGFTVSAGSTSPTATTAPAEGQLALPSLSGDGGSVTFPIPPQKMKLTRTSDKQGFTVDAQEQTTVQMAKADVTTYELNDLLLFGDHVERDIKLLTDWATHRRTTGTDGKPHDTLPPLRFAWGPLQETAFLSYVSTTYTRFASSGQPVRASVTVKLDLAVEAAGQGAQNPSSGGIAGRGSHLMTESDSLPALATRSYGSPARWRELATANGIDDPLRIPAGTSVFLPSDTELETGRSR